MVVIVVRIVGGGLWLWARQRMLIERSRGKSVLVGKGNSASGMTGMDGRQRGSICNLSMSSISSRNCEEGVLSKG